MKEPMKQFNSFEKERVEEYMKGALEYPLRFYYLLLMAGESSVEAQKMMFDIKFSMTRSANVTVRRKLMKLLKNLINIITSDSIIYNRIRSLALNDKLNAIKEESMIFLAYHGFTEESLKNPKNRKAASNLLSMVIGEEQGIAGTGLGIVGGNSPEPTKGIDSYDAVIGFAKGKKERNL